MMNNTGQKVFLVNDFTLINNQLVPKDEYEKYIDEFRNPKIKKKIVWDKTAAHMKQHGYVTVTAGYLDQNLRNMKTTYKRIKDNNKKAVTTFSCSKEFLHPNLEILNTLLDKLTAADVGFNPQFLTEALWKRPGKAPVTYVDVQEDDLLTMGIFILSPGMKIPLHDHPQMYGLIKVLAGKVKLTSFSVIGEDTPPEYFTPPVLMKVEKSPELIIDATSETCILEPCRNNIHEIESIDGPAAFLDILSPPYETETESGRLRKCTYFTVVERLTEKLFRLKEIRPPSWFWSDSYQYEGPEVFPYKKKAQF